MNNLYRLVQPTSAAFDVGRQNTGRSLLSAATGESKSAFRASCSLASACPLFLASGAGQGTARGADRAGGELPAQPQAFAHRRHPTRGVSGISGEPLTEQHAVSLAAPRKGSLPGSIPSVEPLLPVRRSIELACGACFPASPITRNSTTEFRRTSALEVSYQHSRKHLPIAVIRRGVSGISGESLTEQHAALSPLLAKAPFCPPSRVRSHYLPCVDPSNWRAEPASRHRQSPGIRPPNFAGPAHLLTISGPRPSCRHPRC